MNPATVMQNTQSRPVIEAEPRRARCSTPITSPAEAQPMKTATRAGQARGSSSGRAAIGTDREGARSWGMGNADQQQDGGRVARIGCAQ